MQLGMSCIHNGINQQKTRKISYRGIAIVDLGASKENGTIKMSYIDKYGKRFNPPTGEVFKDGCERNPRTFVSGVARRISDKFRDHITRRDPLEGVLIQPPGQPEDGHRMGMLANIKGSDGEPLRNIDFSGIKKILIEEGIPLKKGCKIAVTNDMAGSGVEALQLLLKEEAKPGTKGFYAATGGGFGFVEFETGKRRTSRIYTGELAHTVIGPDCKTMESAKLSAPALVRNWGEKLGLDGEVIKALNNDAIAVLKYDHAVEKLKHLKEQGKINPDVNITREGFNRASQHAISKFVDGFATVVNGQILRRHKEGFIGGPLCLGLDEHLRSQGGNGLCDAILRRAKEIQSPVGEVQSEGFKLRILPIKDNLGGGKVLLGKSTKMFGSVIEVSNKALKETGKFSPASLFRKIGRFLLKLKVH